MGRVTTGLLLAFAATACAFAGTPLPAPAHWRVEQIGHAAINESSGLVKSRQYENVYWTHNDSGDIPRFFALAANGDLIAEYRVTGAAAKDWEDIALDDDGHLYLADVGNNDNDRTNLRIFVVDEPDPTQGSGTVPTLRTLHFRYADQTTLGDRRKMNFDCEAVFWRAGDLYLFTKHRSDHFTKLYRLDPTNLSKQVITPLAKYALSSANGCPKR